VNEQERADALTRTRAHATPSVGIVVVNWRRREVTLACLKALQGLDYPDWRLFLVDNGCEDFTAAELERLFPGVAYMRTAQNLGFAGGSNAGMRAALAAGAAFVWFLNNDAEPEPEALRELVAAAERSPPAAVVGAKVLQKARPERIDSVALHLDLGWGRVLLLGHDEVDRGQYDDLADVDALTGCAMLVRRDALARLGGFDESFFSYLEDADLCLRARAAGLRVAAAPRARVAHDRPVATRGRQSAASLYYATRNHLELVRRHGRGPHWRSALRAAVVFALNLAYALRAGDGPARARVAAVWQGLRDYRLGRFGARDGSRGAT
jgi:hypothetical protein